MMNRRSFAGTMAAGMGAVILSGVNTACWIGGTVYTQIMAYVGVGLTAFQAVVDLLDPTAAIAVDAGVKLVKAAFADLQLAVQDYNNAPAANKTTLLGKISTALAVLQNEMQGFFASLNLEPGKLSTLIEGLLGIILSTLAGFATQLPTPVTPPTGKFGARRVNYAPVKRTKKQFESDFNHKLTDAGMPAVKFS